METGIGNRRSLLQRLVPYELPIEDSIAMQRAYGWDSTLVQHDGRGSGRPGYDGIGT
jgi:hypothetical protein